MSPRYDVPKQAPEPLARVQRFLNSIDLEHEIDWLPDWLDERGLGAELERARALRAALRSLAVANTGEPASEEAVAVVNAAAARLSPRVDANGEVHVTVEGDELDQILACPSRRCSAATGRASRRAATATGRSTTTPRTARPPGARCSSVATERRRAPTGVASRPARAGQANRCLTPRCQTPLRCFATVSVRTA